MPLTGAEVKQLRTVIAEELDTEPTWVVPPARLKEELGADSLDLVEISLAIEEAFPDVWLRDEDLSGWKTVADVERSMLEARERGTGLEP